MQKIGGMQKTGGMQKMGGMGGQGAGRPHRTMWTPAKAPTFILKNTKL